MSCIIAMSAALKSLVEVGSFGSGFIAWIIFIMSSSCVADGLPGISWPPCECVPWAMAGPARPADRRATTARVRRWDMGLPFSAWIS